MCRFENNWQIHTESGCRKILQPLFFWYRILKCTLSMVRQHNNRTQPAILQPKFLMELLLFRRNTNESRIRLVLLADNMIKLSKPHFPIPELSNSQISLGFLQHQLVNNRRNLAFFYIPQPVLPYNSHRGLFAAASAFGFYHFG